MAESTRRLGWADPFRANRSQPVTLASVHHPAGCGGARHVLSCQIGLVDCATRRLLVERARHSREASIPATDRLPPRAPRSAVPSTYGKRVDGNLGGGQRAAATAAAAAVLGDEAVQELSRPVRWCLAVSTCLRAAEQSVPN